MQLVSLMPVRINSIYDLVDNRLTCNLFDQLISQISLSSMADVVLLNAFAARRTDLLLRYINDWV